MTAPLVCYNCNVDEDAGSFLTHQPACENGCVVCADCLEIMYILFLRLKDDVLFDLLRSGGRGSVNNAIYCFSCDERHDEKTRLNSKSEDFVYMCITMAILGCRTEWGVERLLDQNYFEDQAHPL